MGEQTAQACANACLQQLWLIALISVCAAKVRILELVGPVFLGVGFVVKMVYNVAFGWWLDPWLRRKANRALMDDITANLYFLVSGPHAGVPRSIGVLKSEWPTVEIPWGNLLFTVVRWRGDTNVCVAPCHAPEESYELGPLVAALESRHFSERDVVNDLADAANLLRPRLQVMNAAFSAQEFPRIKGRL
jgi:hypothetical protein